MNHCRDEGDWRRGPAEEASSWRDSGRRDDRDRDDRRRERDDRRDLRERRDDRDRRGPPLRSEREEGKDSLHSCRTVGGPRFPREFWILLNFLLSLYEQQNLDSWWIFIQFRIRGSHKLSGCSVKLACLNSKYSSRLTELDSKQNICGEKIYFT